MSEPIDWTKRRFRSITNPIRFGIEEMFILRAALSAAYPEARAEVVLGTDGLLYSNLMFYSDQPDSICADIETVIAFAQERIRAEDFKQIETAIN